jgi:phosphate-selective porin OprO/OprP
VIGRLVAGAIAACLLVPAAAALAETDFGWSKALYLSNEDKGFHIKFGGRIQDDWVWNNADAALDAAITGIANGTEFRRARLYTEGTVYYNVYYKFQMDFAGGDADFKDVFVGVKNLPLIYSLRVGHQYEPAGLETITSSKYITFLERSSVASLMPERNTGITAFRAWPEDRMTVTLGAFRNADAYGDATGDVWAGTGRVTFCPIIEDKGEKLLHLGVSYSYRESQNGVFIQTAKPENPVAPTFVNTDTLFADNYQLIGTEAAFTWGPFSTQGEFAISQALDALNEDSVSVGDPVFDAYYVQVSYFLTGEHRTYKGGQMGGVGVNKPFTGQDGGGAGAWEVAARYSTMDLNYETIMGGEFNVATIGVNWYLNDVFRIMFDYSHVDYTDVGKMNSFGTRFSLYF